MIKFKTKSEQQEKHLKHEAERIEYSDRDEIEK